MTLTHTSLLDQPSRTLVRFSMAVFFGLFSMAVDAAEPSPELILKSASPLAGRIWLPKERRLTTPEDLVSRVLNVGIVALGETHDNPDHHALQAWMVRRLVAAGRRPVAAFEMMDADQQPVVESQGGDMAGLGQAVEWEKRGWPDWGLYRPIAEAVMVGGGGLIAANLPIGITRDISKGKETTDIRARYGLDDAQLPAVDAAMAADIREGHCNMLPEAAVAPMVRVQRARDAALAEAVAMQATRPEVGPVVLIAGSGHGRLDRGAPARLREMVPGIRIFSIAFLEVGDSETDSAAASRFGKAPAPFDAVWFTAKVEREDPCAQMERHMKKEK